MSAPASLVIWPTRGVRPNSPRATTRVVEKAEALEVFEQCGEAAIEHREDRFFQEREVVAMGIPALVEAGACADCDDADAGLDETAGEE